MSSQNDVANIACAILGVSPISVSIASDQTLHAITLNSLWNLERDSELRKRIWKFSITRATVNPVIFSGTMIAGGVSADDGYQLGVYGSLNPLTDLNGNTVNAVSDIGGSGTFVFGVTSSTAIAQNYFDTISIAGGAISTTLASSAATFVSGGGQYTWSWTGTLGIVNGTTYTVGLNTNGLAPVTGTAPVGTVYNYVYPLPTNCLRLLQAGDSDFSFPGIDLSDYRSMPTTDDYVVEGGAILTNQTAPLYLRYVQQVTNVALWDPAFCEAVGARLAHRACFRISQSLQQQKLAQQEYTMAIQAAMKASALESPPQYAADDSWVLTRPIGSGGAPTTRIG